MNLNDFIKHGHICPICKSNSMTLKMGFGQQSYVKQSYLYVDNNVIFTREMRSIKKSDKKYMIGYSINKKTNQFQIEFSLVGKQLKDSVPISILERFRELDKNLRRYNFIRKCTNCDRYQYWSNSFTLDYKNTSVGDLTIVHEYFGLCKQIGSKYRVFKIDNNYVKNDCIINCFEADSMIFAGVGSGGNYTHPLTMKLKPIKFTTEDKITNRLSKLLVFA